jgi:hypothetical protein
MYKNIYDDLFIAITLNLLLPETCDATTADGVNKLFQGDATLNFSLRLYAFSLFK